MKKIWITAVIVVIGLGGFILGSQTHQFEVRGFSDISDFSQPPTDKPTVAIARNALDQYWDKFSGSKTQVIAFVKTNGQEIYFGVPIYRMDYMATIKILRDVTSNYHNYTYKILPTNPPTNTPSIKTIITPAIKTLYGVGELKAGTTFKVRGTITFEKKEGGWEVDTISSRLL